MESYNFRTGRNLWEGASECYSSISQPTEPRIVARVTSGACRTCWFLVLTLGHWGRLSKGEAWESAFILCFCPTPRRRGASLVAQMVKNLPGMQETQVQSLSWEDPPEKGTVPLFLSGEFHGQRNLAGYSPFQRVRHNWTTCTFPKKEKKKSYAFQEIICRGITKASLLVNLVCFYLCVTSA